MRLLLTGGSGILGRALRRRLSGTGIDLWAPGREELDITDGDACRRAVLDFRPDCLIHAAAWTRVDDCEADPARAMEVNGEATGRLARACREAGARLLYISTDYVFDGRGGSPYREEDPPGPINAYGRSKLRGEELVGKILGDSLIIRTSWLYGHGGRNFVDTIAQRAASGERLRVVDDQRGSPTYAGDLAGALAGLL
ncbi:MAG: dTDP-4-dehydrorhamnose reductase, partial [Nitrospinota bacterium]